MADFCNLTAFDETNVKMFQNIIVLWKQTFWDTLVVVHTNKMYT